MIRHDRETQRGLVERTLRQDGEISTYDALFNTSYLDGRKTSITRLAAIIHNLRTDGWEIDTKDESGQVATYVLRGYTPRVAVPVWRCTVCGGPPSYEPTSLLGGLGEAHCAACRHRTAFQKKAA